MVQDYFFIDEAVWKPFTTIIFCCIEQISPDLHWRNRIKQNDHEHHEKESFFSASWVLERFFCFVFEKMSSSLPMLLVMLFVHVGKRSNSRSQIFFKVGVLTNFAIFTGKHVYWNLFLITLQDWRLTFL